MSPFYVVRPKRAARIDTEGLVIKASEGDLLGRAAADNGGFPVLSLAHSHLQFYEARRVRQDANSATPDR